MGIKGGAGALDKWIEFWRLPKPDSAKNDLGELTSEPTKDFGCHAALDELGGGRQGSEFRASEKRHSESTAKWRIRWNRKVNPQMAMGTHEIRYVEYGMCNVVRRFDIKAVTSIGRMEEMHIEVSEVL